MRLAKHKLHRYILLLYALVVVMALGIGVYKAFANTDALTGVVVVNNFCVFTTNVDTGGITFGGSAGLNPNSNTIGTVNSMLITDTGNLNSNILVSGSNWNYFSNSFYVSNTIYNAIGEPYFVPPRLSYSTADSNIIVPGSGGANVIYFGVGAPAGQAPGVYTQTINVISNC